MNRVPTKAFLDLLGDSTEGLSDDEIQEKIQALDQALRI
jgi:hypothetical protein